VPRNFELADAAKAELASANRWLSQPGSGENAARRRRLLGDAIRDLRRHPCRWPIGDHPGIRERSVGGYRILYEVSLDTGDDATAGDVRILRIFGPYQDRTDL
jgi:plasmid stabilization system protein ParE